MPSLNWLRLLKVGIPLIGLVIAGLYLYSMGYKASTAHHEAEDNKEKLAMLSHIDQLKDRIASNAQKYNAQSAALSEKLAAAQAEHLSYIASLKSAYALRLRESGERAGIYERMSQASAAERASLAGHAAELDRALEEGRLLVGELRSTLAQRDQQLVVVGNELVNTRQLMEAEAAGDQ